MNVWVALGIGLVAGTLVLGAAAAMQSGSNTPEATSIRLIPAGALVLDLSTGSWSPAGDLKEAREDHYSLLLPDGKVLILGGNAGRLKPVNRAELYDPSTRTFTSAGEWAGTGGSLYPSVRSSGEVFVFAVADSGNEPDATRWTAPSTWTRIPLPAERGIRAAACLPDDRLLLVHSEGSWTGDGRGEWVDAGALRFNSTPVRGLL